MRSPWILTLIWPIVVPASLLAGQWPVTPPTVTRPFQPPSQTWSAGHRGTDLAAATGDSVRSMAAGTVGFVGMIAGVPVVTVRYPGEDHRRSTYEPVVATVAVGQAVRTGDVLGTLAATGGHCGGQNGCLHVGLKTDAGYLDPASLVRPPAAVLKPLR